MNTVDPLTWAILLMLVGCGLTILEVFIPSGGVLGFLATFAVVASIAMAMYHRGATVGLMFALVAVIAIPAGLAVALKYWPDTPMGRRFLLGLPTEEEVTPDDKRQRLINLIGRPGVVKSPMLPSGVVEVEGKIVDAVTEGMALDPGDPIKVLEVRAYRVLVRKIDTDEARSLASDAPDELLNRPLDELGIEPLDDPLS